MEDESEGEEVGKKRSRKASVLKKLPDWEPPRRKELERWRRLFALDDELIGVYVCSVRAKVTHQGRLFISFDRQTDLGHLSFRGVTILRSALEFTVRLDNVKDVRYNADKAATLVLETAISMKGQRDAVKVVELRTGGRALAALSALFARPTCAPGDEEEDVDSSSDEGMPMSKSRSAREVSPGSTPVEEEPWNRVLEVHIPRLKVSPMVEELLSEEWSRDSFMKEYFAEVGATELCVENRVDDSDSGSSAQLRELTYVMPVPPAPMCPKTTRMTTSCRISVEGVDRAKSVIDLSSVTHDVPFGQNFVVQERYELLQDEHEDGTSLTKSTRIIWLKSVGWLKGRIQSSNMSEQAKAANVFLAVLRRRAPESPVGRSGGESGYATCVERVWEMQRRTTLFQSDWRAPFLPHDGDKRWRWVDSSYSRHRCMQRLTREEAAAASEPPLRAAAGWRMQGRWTVNLDGLDKGLVDKDGWQYAIDLYRYDTYWSSRSTGMHCRRRLWTCSLQEDASGA